MDPAIRAALLARFNADEQDTTHLRSFLDLGSKRRGWRKTRKGSGTVSWNIHTHNSINGFVRELNRLSSGASAYFFNCADFPRRMVLTRKATVIHTCVSINGTDWHVGNICEYLGYMHTGIFCSHYVHIMCTLCAHFSHINVRIVSGTMGTCALVSFACMLSSDTGRTVKTRRQANRCLFRHDPSPLMAFYAKTAVEGTHFAPTL